jgi:hypothetical protein
MCRSLCWPPAWGRLEARAGGSVRTVTDPFLFSASDDEAEDFVARDESRAELAAGVREALEAGGFHRHDCYGAGGGFCINAHIRDEAVLVAWAAREATPHDTTSLERQVELIMQPALVAILAASGFDARPIPDGEDDAGCILVYGRADPPQWPPRTFFSSSPAGA